MTPHTEQEGQSCNDITRFQKKIIFIISFATTCIILTYITELPHPTLIHTEWDKLKIIFSCVFSLFMYFLIICAIFKECRIICLLFVSLFYIFHIFVFFYFISNATVENRKYTQYPIIGNGLIRNRAEFLG